MMKSKIALFFKGMAMGTVDIVPGVSGSTVAVLLGIYERFISALRNINGTLFKALFRPFAQKFSAESRRNCAQACREADLPWLANLMLGLCCAFIAASFVIPVLMEKFPTVMRGLFFGLVLGSIVTPIREITRFKWHLPVIAGIFAAFFYIILGQQVEAPAELTPVIADGTQSLSQICAAAPCFYTPADILSIAENAPLREAAVSPETVIAAGTEVFLLTPYAAYCLAAGFLGICAMLLPGISGSFILLVMGCYYFMLNTGKGFINALLHGEFLGMHLLYIGCFAFGALAGIAVFSRALSWLLKHCRDAALAAIIGILLGCLRAIWPFKTTVGDISVNVMPPSDASVIPVIIAAAAGLSIVALTVFIQIRLKCKGGHSEIAENRGTP